MKRAEISESLRKRRLALGLSLSELARRAGTSAAALSRYESGWRRFEVGTLRKIAVALGCDLKIELTPVRPPRPRSRRTAMTKLTRLFWDHDLKPGDLKRHPAWVISRILEYGNLDDVRILQSVIGKREFLRKVAGSRFSSSRTEAFWRCMLEVEGVACTKRSFPREAWIS